MNIIESLLTQVLAEDSVEEISKTTQASGEQVTQVISSAIPALLKYMTSNAETDEGASSLSDALDEHTSNKKTSIVSLIQDADLSDGKKILEHILGDDNSKVQTDISESTGLKKGQVGKILAIAAPILLSFIGYQKKKTKTSSDGIAGLLSSLFETSTSSSLLETLLGGSSSKKNDVTTQIVSSLLSNLLK